MLRETHKIDATDKVLGRLASQIAAILRGKNKVAFLPSNDIGDFVEVSHAEKIRVTGNKAKQKLYHHFSGQVGGLKTAKYEEKMKKSPTFVLRTAVYSMLPKNRLRAEMIKRLKFVE